MERRFKYCHRMMKYSKTPFGVCSVIYLRIDKTFLGVSNSSPPPISARQVVDRPDKTRDARSKGRVLSPSRRTEVGIRLVSNDVWPRSVLDRFRLLPISCGCGT